MNKSAAFCIFLVLLAGMGNLAHAQPAPSMDAQAPQAQPVMEPVLYCTQQAVVYANPQPCEAGQPDAVTHPGSVVTRLEIECLLSGNCEVAERSRIHY